MDEPLINAFDDWVRSVVDGTATKEEHSRMAAVMRDNPVLRERYCAQMRVHALLKCRSGRVRTMAKSRQTSRCDVSPQPSAWGRRAGWKKAAAAAVLLLGGMAVWQRFSPTSDLRSPVFLSPVTLMRQVNVRGLDLPSALPGIVRLTAGEVMLRLGSGVRLTVLGPASLQVHNVMEVTLEKGRLLADVPHWATGFLVRTADLEVCDLGTVFSVSVDWPVCDVFVFKGRVRVNEAGHGESGNATAGEDLGICGAGEGVRAEAGERPVKFAADWPAAKKAFASVRDQAATEKPAVALAFAEKIADLWMDAYLPREMARLEAQRLAAASVPEIPFRKTAWVRSSAPQQEVSNMKSANAAAVLAAAVLALGAEKAPALSNEIAVNTSVTQNRRWSAAYTNEVTLKWSWVSGAARAGLDIVGMNGSFSTNFAEVTTNCLWRTCPGAVPSAEDVYDLRLTFYGGGGGVVGALTSRVAVVKGAFGEAEVNPAASGTAWPKVKENAVMPYDAGWAEATDGATNSRLVIAKVGGATQTNALADACGYFGWKLKHSDWGYGTFNLALTFSGKDGEWDATLIRPMDGTMIRMQ
jgi:ferric-dicitrate binding protein FerR (iron transport regulator)